MENSLIENYGSNQSPKHQPRVGRCFFRMDKQDTRARYFRRGSQDRRGRCRGRGKGRRARGARGKCLGKNSGYLAIKRQ